MNRNALWCALLILGAAAPAWAGSNTYFGFQIGISNAPPRPRVVFRQEPRVVVVPNTRVYVIEDNSYDCDVFRYGTYWYVSSGGYWYRARSYRGPFAVVDVRYVPRPIFYVPAKHWRHHPHGGPPGQMKMKKRDGWAMEQKAERRKHGKRHGDRHDDD